MEQAGIELLRHQLRLFGLHARTARDIEIVAAPDAAILVDRRCGHLLIALQPQADFVAALGGRSARGDSVLEFAEAAVIGIAPRSLHASQAYECASAQILLRDADQRAIWFHVETGDGDIIVIGTDLIGDLVRYRQGDPARVGHNAEGSRWGFAFERPNYLYEAQLDAAAPRRRYADEWAWLLMRSVADILRVTPGPLLPGGARGALVITGDDDQACLDKYAEQRQLLRGLPCTYFMHPLTKHTRRTARQMFDGRVELALHPDALDAPAAYAQKLAEQASWFTGAFGRRARSVRNHGFLNDGYWNHLPAWQAAGIEFSSNVPGVDGTVLTGSLIPTRVIANEGLTSHWSVLTAFGDGMLFALGMADADAGEHMRMVGREVLRSPIPGVLVVNLHPQNVGETHAVHTALRAMVADGFVPWNMAECLSWFKAADARGDEVETSGPLQRLWSRVAGLVKVGHE